MCAAHATVRGLLHDVTEQAGTVVIDMEAGLEHLSRGTPRYVDTLLLVVEPYFKSMETAARCKVMAEELGIPHILAVPNKVMGRRGDAQLFRPCRSSIHGIYSSRRDDFGGGPPRTGALGSRRRFTGR